MPVSEAVGNISFLSTVLELYSETALSRKPFGIGHMYTYNFLLGMTDNMTSQNIDLSSWDTLYVLYLIRVFSKLIYRSSSQNLSVHYNKIVFSVVKRKEL
jgi:hypothetical protein